jgi:5'-nucleotidase
LKEADMRPGQRPLFPGISWQLARVLAVLAAILLLSAQTFGADNKPFHLLILHTNDIHARLAEFNRFGQTCTDDESAKGECFGGYPRIAAAINQARKLGPSLLLDAGDQFQGTLFYTVLKGRPSREAMNRCGYTAMTLGNHEFDDGPASLVDTFLSGLNFPVLAANLEAEAVPALKSHLAPFTVVTVAGRKIGLVGLANEDTSTLSSPGPDLTFTNAAPALAKAVAALHAQGAAIVIAITHVGLDRDEQLGAAVDGVSVIVGGHSHTLLSNTDPSAAGPYPVVVKSPSGRPVLIVQAEAWGKYLGELGVDFDAQGAPVAYSGAPLLLDKSQPQDPAMLELVKDWEKETAPFLGQTVGSARQSLELAHDGCRQGECPLGDLLADSLRLAAKPQGAQAAFINGGAVRAGLKAGDITAGDLLTVYPFTDTVATFELTGADLALVLEHGLSLAGDTQASGTGRFLQVSGLRYSFNPAKPAGKRLANVEILAPDGAYAPLDPDKSYVLASTGYLLKGGDGYVMLKDKARKVYAFGKPVSDALIDYVNSHSPLDLQIEGRITRLAPPK